MKNRIRSLIASKPPKFKWRFVNGSWRLKVNGKTAIVERGTVVCYRIGDEIAGTARTVEDAKRACEEWL